MRLLARVFVRTFCLNLTALTLTALTLTACVTPSQGPGAGTTARSSARNTPAPGGSSGRTPTPHGSGSGATGSGSGRTKYGFYTTAPDLTARSRTRTLRAISRHADALLLQPEVPWVQFLSAPDGRSAVIDGLRATVGQARRAGLEPIFVIDPLKGMDRTRFATLPAGLGSADFGTPQLRRAYGNFAVRISREFHPRYLGLGAEINTYAAAHPADFPNFVSLYRETYAAVKAESPSTKVFVSFQWEGPQRPRFPRAPGASDPAARLGASRCLRNGSRPAGDLHVSLFRLRLRSPDPGRLLHAADSPFRQTAGHQ